VSSQLEVTVSPAVLKWARHTAGYSLEHAAQHIRRPPAVLDAWESGGGLASWAALRELADFYRRPAAVFLLSEPPDEPKYPLDYRSPSIGRGLSAQTRLAVRQALRLQEVADDLSASWPRVRGRDEDITADDLAGRERRRLRVRLEEQFGWADPYEAFRRWRSAVEETGVLVLQTSMPVEEVQGFSLAGNGGPPTIVVNTGDDIRPRIFTLFHEYCHALFGGGGICLPESRLATIANRGEEQFCNAFAGALLVPRGALLRDEAARRLIESSDVPSDSLFGPLVAKFEVSRQVIWHRLYSLGKIPKDRFRAKWAMWRALFRARPHPAKKSGPAMSKAARALNERGRGFVSMVLRAEGEGQISHAEALEYLGIRADHFGSLLSLSTRPG